MYFKRKLLGSVLFAGSLMASAASAQAEIASIMPGLLGAVGLALTAYIIAVRKDFPVEERFQVSRVWATFKDAAWAFLLPVIILGDDQGQSRLHRYPAGRTDNLHLRARPVAGAGQCVLLMAVLVGEAHG